MSKRQHAVQFSTVAKVLLVGFFLGGSGVGYVLQKGQIVTLENQKSRNEVIIDRLVNDDRRWNAELDRATTSPQINGYLQLHNVQMQQTDFQNIVTVQEPVFTVTKPGVSLVGP
jgi:hypothetical protein